MRNRNIVIKSQFNINGSRGKSVKSFITDYVARETDANISSSYINPNIGDGVCFTLGDTAISNEEVHQIAEHVETLFQTGKRAIQQLVISFDHDYLKQIGIIDEDLSVLAHGDYIDKYDDVLLRHAVRYGLQQLVDYDGYHDAKVIGTIQHDKTHLHVHAVLYEDSDITRKRGREEKGVIKNKSFEQCANGIDLFLRQHKSHVITNEKLFVNYQSKVSNIPQDTTIDNHFYMIEQLQLLLRQQQEAQASALQKQPQLDYFPEW